MTTTRKRSAPELIGFHLGSDMRDVSDGRYQSTRYAAPGVYVVGGSYWCAPTSTQKLPEPDRWSWTEAGEYYGRKVYWAD